MIRRRRPELSVEDVVNVIRENAAELRNEARKVELSHQRMDEIADRMEELVGLLRDAGGTEEETDAGT